MKPHDKSNKHNVRHFLEKAKTKFRSSDKKKTEALHLKTNSTSSSTVTSLASAQPISKKADSIHQASNKSQSNVQPKLDLWQEALDKARQSNDWKIHQEEYDQAVLECITKNQNILSNSITRNSSFPDAIHSHLELLLEKAREQQWGYESSQGEKIYFRDVISRILQWVKVFKDAGSQLADLDPTKAAPLVWGFVQFFVERAVVYNETRDMAIDQEPIANMVTRYALIENLYINNIPGVLSEADEAIKGKMVALYTEIILYQIAIFKFWKQGKITHGIQSLVPHKLKELSSSIQKRSQEAESALNQSDREVLLQVQATIQLKIQEPIAQIGVQLQQVLDVVKDIAEDRYSDVLKWVSPILHLDHHREFKPMEGTGQWILNHSTWKEWRHSQKSGLFWLRGKIGAGKSNVVSTVISHLLKESMSGQEQVAYFYINGTNRAEEAKSAETVLRSLLKQLAIQGSRALLQPVITKYDQLRSVSSLGKEDCIDLLVDVVRESRQTNIMIDGFDEMKDDDIRNDVLKSLKRITEGSQGAIVKVFISSRDYVDIYNLMDEIWPSRDDILVAKRNCGDIERFITSRVEDLEKKLPYPIPEDIRRNMEYELKARSNGMFLWVDLSLKYIMQIKAKNPNRFVEYLNSVPTGLKDTYIKLYNSVLEEQPHENVATIQLIIRFLMYGYHHEVFKAPVFLSTINYKRNSTLSEKDVLDLCYAFVELDPETQDFRLIHFSVKEFFQDLAEYEYETSNAAIAAHCITYLNDQLVCRYYIDRLSGRSYELFPYRKYALGSYETESWILHCARAAGFRQKSPLVELLSKFWGREGRKKRSPFERWVGGLNEWFTGYLRDSWNPRDEWFEQIISGGYTSLILGSKPTAFFLACEYDLREVVEDYLSNGWDVNDIVPNRGPGLSYACIGNRSELASHLIRSGAKTMFDNDRNSPIIAAIEAGRPEMLRLLLQHTETITMEQALETALYCFFAPYRQRKMLVWKSPSTKTLNRILEVLLDHSSEFEYSDGVQQRMFRTSPELLGFLLTRNRSLLITNDTLKYLFDSAHTLTDVQAYVKLLLPLNYNLVTTESFLVALEHYQSHENALDVIRYTHDLTSSDPSVCVSEAAFKAAIKNPKNSLLLTNFLLQENPSIKISDETILLAVRESNLTTKSVICELLLRHDPTVRNFHPSDIKQAFNRMVAYLPVCEFMVTLLRYSPELIVDQELFTQAISGFPELESLRFLLSRAIKISLTPQLISNVMSFKAVQIIREIVFSTSSEEITNEVLLAALNNFHLMYERDQSSSTMAELLSRAPDSLELSEDLVYKAASCYPWILEQVLERWSNAALSERAIAAALKDVENFDIVRQKRPAVEFSNVAIESLCENKHHPCPTTIMDTILVLQPNTKITERMLILAADIYIDGDNVQELLRLFNALPRGATRHINNAQERVRLFDTLLRHVPHAEMTDPVVYSAILSGPLAGQIMFEGRPDHKFSASSIGEVCKAVTDNEESQLLLDQILKRSEEAILDENEMSDIIISCSPKTVLTLLSGRPDAVVTEKIVKRLLEEIISKQTLKFENLDNFAWFDSLSPHDKAFEMLLDRTGLRGGSRQLLIAEFQKLKDKRQDFLNWNF